MFQVYTNPVLGPMYGVAAWLIGSCIALYYAMGTGGMTIEQRERMPRWLLNRNVCLSIAVVCAMAAGAKYVRFF
jgi:hypothetical protein